MYKRGECNTSANGTHGGLYPSSTYDDPSELEIEFRLEALWLLSPDLDGMAGTTSWDRWIVGAVLLEVRFLPYPVSVTKIRKFKSSCISPEKFAFYILLITTQLKITYFD